MDAKFISVTKDPFGFGDDITGSSPETNIKHRRIQF